MNPFKEKVCLKKEIALYCIDAIEELYETKISEKDLMVNLTKPEFQGDYTIVLFGLSKILNVKIPDLGKQLGDFLMKKHESIFESYVIAQGFLNLIVGDYFLDSFLNEYYGKDQFGKKSFHGKKVIVEYSSPNTNKPLHLGHLRNNFLGYSIAKIYEWNGYDVFRTCIVNDRGVHICKSMLAWQRWGKEQTPQSVNKKGDHLVGDFYVLFSNELKKQVAELKAKGIQEEVAEKQTELMQSVQAMLVAWERGDEDVVALWKKMNAWVYEGFEETYKKIGTKFDKIYYESNTYLLGKHFVEKGLEERVFYKKTDGSVWINLEDSGLDQKLLLRKDGTSVYITQDLGLAEYKYDDFSYEKSIYVVGDEQNYHFQVLKLILQKIQKPYAEGIYHLSYGMVELPTGKMKSREGTVVDADDLIQEMTLIAAQHTKELGKVEGFLETELQHLSMNIGLAALKFYLLKVDPKKKMIFNPEESIDLQGFTGPFIQYTYARICSILNKIQVNNKDHFKKGIKFEKLERDVLLEAELFDYYLEQSLLENNPSLIAIYTYQLAKKFNSFYASHSILKTLDKDLQQRRLKMCILVQSILKNCADILGIALPSKM